MKTISSKPHPKPNDVATMLGRPACRHFDVIGCLIPPAMGTESRKPGAMLYMLDDLVSFPYEANSVQIISHEECCHLGSRKRQTTDPMM
jgi:hypothetical protein